MVVLIVNITDVNPGDFVTNVKQINSQSDLTWMSSFACPSYVTVRSSLYIILIWDTCIFNIYNLCQTGSSYVPSSETSPLCNEQIIRTHFLLLQPSVRPLPAQVVLLWKGLPKLCNECHLLPLWAFPLKSPRCRKYLHFCFVYVKSSWNLNSAFDIRDQ